jgi:uncharacterized membrane protein
VKSDGGSEWESKAPVKLHSTTYSATDGSFRYIRQRRAIIMAGDWQVIGKVVFQLINGVTMTVGWHKFVLEIRKIINGVEREAISNEIDHVVLVGVAGGCR